ncbi:helix-turn-helix domain-containing protein [Arthrobacter sp. ok909]|uniref:helix-turn-helix domain-containing protein n=1 Tax=Arthrobacter sp. ok909 TaxID=1761746 RepID=UPI0034A1E149
MWRNIDSCCGPACRSHSWDREELVGSVWPHDDRDDGRRRRPCLPCPSPEGQGGRALTRAERGMIQMGRRSRLSYARIGTAMGRDRSVVRREVNRNTGADGCITPLHENRHSGGLL